MKKKAKYKQLLKNGGLFILLLSATLYIVFKEQDIHAIMKAVSQADFRFVLLGVLAMLLFLACEGCNIARALQLLGCRVRYRSGLKYAMIGFFFSSVTPSASGGQPMQLCYMHRDGVQVSKGTMALLLELLSFETVTILLAAAGLLYQQELIFSLGAVRYLLFLGMGLNLLVAALLALAVFSPAVAERLAGLAIRAVSILSSGKAEKARAAIENQLRDYAYCSKYLRENRIFFAKTLATTMLQMLSMYSVPYFVYCAFGLHTFQPAEVLALQAVLYVSVSALPLPGAMGVSESTFMLLFCTLFPESLLGSAMLLSRGISFYLFVLISGIAAAGSALIQKKEKREKSDEVYDSDRRRRQRYHKPAASLPGKPRVQSACSGDGSSRL